MSYRKKLIEVALRLLGDQRQVRPRGVERLLKFYHTKVTVLADGESS